MPARKIRFGIVTYAVEVDGGRRQELASRGQIVDIPDIDGQLERLDRMGATVAPDAEFNPPGILQPLTDDPSDEELRSWMAAATSSELADLIAERPDLADRLGAKHQVDLTVVQQGVARIEEYLTAHPEDAEAILEEERRLAGEQGREVRKGVEKAAQEAVERRASEG